MDIRCEGAGKKKWIRRGLTAAIVVAALGGATWYLGHLQPAAVTVEKSTLWPDTVKRGPLLRQVRGMGTLVPEEILFVPAITEGRVEKILLRAGAHVRSDTVLLEMSNPELQLAAFDAEWQVKAADANFKDLRVKLERERLDQEANAARIQSEFNQAKLQADRDEALLKLGLKSDLDYRLTRAKADELEGRIKIEKQRLGIFKDSVEAQLAAQRVQIEKLKAAWDLKKQQVAQLKVRSSRWLSKLARRCSPALSLPKSPSPKS
jgi:HlyD family secretion protein